jgi:hypothetical protein
MVHIGPFRLRFFALQTEIDSDDEPPTQSEFVELQKDLERLHSLAPPPIPDGAVLKPSLKRHSTSPVPFYLRDASAAASSAFSAADHVRPKPPT